MDYRKEYEYWLNDPYFDEETKAELRAIAEDEKEIFRLSSVIIRQCLLRSGADTARCVPSNSRLINAFIVSQ